MKFIRHLAALMLCVLLVIATATTALAAPFKTYTYDIYGLYNVSPHAFVPDYVLNFLDMGIDGQLFNPTDLHVDHHNQVFLADSGNNRVIVLDPDLMLIHEFSEFTGPYGPETFDTPTGTFVDPRTGLIYIADSRNNRIVIFNEDFTLYRILEAPDPETLPDGFIYEPFSMVVHPSGQIYVVSLTTNMGLISLTADGRFDGFIGATRTSQSIMGFIREMIQTQAQRARLARNVPTEYNNIAIDEQGFIFATTSGINPWAQLHAMASGDTSTDNAPIKRLNAMGQDILRRNGFFPPAGDLVVAGGGYITRFIAVAPTLDGKFSVLDAAQNRIFTYDSQGRLLYAFGGTGTQRGVFQSVRSLAYQHDGTVLLVLDDATNRITRFTRTAYGDAIANAIRLQTQRRYTEAYEAWREVLRMNSHLDIAYSGIGMIQMREHDFAAAMENFRMANDIDNYFGAAQELRLESGRVYLLVIPISVIVLAIAISRFLRYAKKKNTTPLYGRSANLWDEFIYGFHVIFRPFDGFWDLKYERRGGIRGAILILALVLGGNVFFQLFAGRAIIWSDFRPITFTLVLPILLPLALWCVANWGLTTLMDGKGSMKDIFISTCYALMPMVLLTVPAAIVSNFLLLSEAQFIHALTSIGLAWSLMLVFLGALVTNEYTFVKNLATSVLSVFAMAFMAFLGVLFINLLLNMFNFGNTIYSEIMFRM